MSPIEPLFEPLLTIVPPPRGRDAWPSRPSAAIIEPYPSPLQAQDSAPLPPHRGHLEVAAGATPVVRPSALRSALAAFAALVASSALTPGSALAQAPRADQVFRRDPRGSGEVVAVTGLIESHGLERVVVARKDGNPIRIDSAEVLEVRLGDVPQAFADANLLRDRGELEKAVARYRVAAGDASARPVVQASARLAAAETLLQWGAEDPTRFREAAAEADLFLGAFAQDRNVPRARALKGRAELLAGDAAAAGATYEALFQAGQAGTIGYPRTLTLQAGYDGAQAFVAARKMAEATALFDALASGVTAAPREGLSRAALAQLDGLAELAPLGPGFVQLAEGKADRAESFFRGKVDGAQTGAGRSAAQLGYGEALLAQSRTRQAQLALASASALSYTSADVEARALVGLAKAYVALGDAAEAKKSLERVRRTLGATPAAAEAAELLKTL